MLAADTLALVDRLVGAPVDVVGHPLGGRVAQGMALDTDYFVEQRPEEGDRLFSTWGGAHRPSLRSTGPPTAKRPGAP